MTKMTMINRPKVNTYILHTLLGYSVPVNVESDTMEDHEDNYHMSKDPREAGVVTDEATSAELQLLISNTITKCRSIIKMI
jgi:hypothetical protein